jgi:hypothetical protein
MGKKVGSMDLVRLSGGLLVKTGENSRLVQRCKISKFYFVLELQLINHRYLYLV